MPLGCQQSWGYEIALEFTHPALAFALCYGLLSHRPNAERNGPRLCYNSLSEHVEKWLAEHIMKLNQEAKNMIAILALVAALVLTVNDVALAGGGRHLLPWSAGLLLVFDLFLDLDASRCLGPKSATMRLRRQKKVPKGPRHWHGGTTEKTREERQSSKTAISEVTAADPSADTPAAVADDLTRISGIGKVFQGVLQEAGISRFEQLANISPQDLIEIISATNYISPPSIKTWPRQAAYAARADWDGLREYQQSLQASS